MYFSRLEPAGDVGLLGRRRDPDYASGSIHV
jgi:hypothetical protein